MNPMEALLARMTELQEYGAVLRALRVDCELEMADRDVEGALTDGDGGPALAQQVLASLGPDGGVVECIDDLLALVALLIQDHNDLLELMDSFIKAKEKADAAPKLVVAGTGDLQAIRQGQR